MEFPVTLRAAIEQRAAEIISLACILCGAIVQLISRNRTKHRKVDSILSEVAAS